MVSYNLTEENVHQDCGTNSQSQDLRETKFLESGQVNRAGCSAQSARSYPWCIKFISSYFESFYPKQDDKTTKTQGATGS